ncbi:unnamed protein product [Penicillium camemberti]|uniref:Str. FM013 n=1 Tax=Penicillium camemberti (strain FM 013) TaxID=1429867 RepID=A0A0G4NY43_PENC3|nr:unnamed protein product [Penicillium camemberti]
MMQSAICTEVVRELCCASTLRTLTKVPLKTKAENWGQAKHAYSGVSQHSHPLRIGDVSPG